MANRRMFAKTIIDSDPFLDMPLSSQSLYFHMCMRADDDGFLNNPKKILRMVGASEDDLKILLAKRFILWMPPGIAVIKHWKMHNYIQKDRYTKTVYTEEMELLKLNHNKSYSYLYPERIQSVSTLEPQVRLGEVRDREKPPIIPRNKQPFEYYKGDDNDN